MNRNPIRYQWFPRQCKSYPLLCEHSLILKRVVLSLYFRFSEEGEVYYKLQSIQKEIKEALVKLMTYKTLGYTILERKVLSLNFRL